MLNYKALVCSRWQGRRGNQQPKDSKEDAGTWKRK